METILRYVIIAAVGALASILANQSIAVFNDGLRPVLPEYLEKRMDRKALAATSFAIGFGLVIGYGLPTSIAASIILIHCILLTTDIIGTWCPDTKKGMIASGVIGAVYGVALLFGLQVIIDLFNLLPVNFLGSLGQVSAGITLAFAIFPAVTVALQFGAAKGIITAVVTLLVRQIVETYGKIALDAEHTVSLNKDGMALLAEGDRVNAGLTALARAIGFIPLVATTAITTGVYAPAGMTFVFVIGLLIPSPFIALIAGAACICVEILLLNVIAKGLDKFPGIKRCGDNIRTAMSYVIDIALLIGGILAAQAIMPTTGLFIIVAFWCINKCSKKPLVSMAVGPLGAILVGLIANVLFLLSLYTPAA